MGFEGERNMKRLEYFKLNFNMAKNETMIATLLAAIAPILASLGERESLRSFLMGTDGPSAVQVAAGGVLLIIAVVILAKGIVKIAYDSIFGETAQIYSTLPISFTNMAAIKMAILSLNTLILLLGLGIGTTIAWLFGNNDMINVGFNTVIALATSGVIERIVLIPLGVIAVIVLVFFINHLIFGGFCMFASSTVKPRGELGKAKALLSAVIYAAVIGWILLKSCGKLLIYMANNYVDNLWIAVAGTTGVLAVVGIIGFGICVYKLKNEYYL